MAILIQNKNSDLRALKLIILRNNKLLLAAFAGKTELDELGNEKKSGHNTYWHCGDDLRWQQQVFLENRSLMLAFKLVFKLVFELAKVLLHLCIGIGIGIGKIYLCIWLVRA